MITAYKIQRRNNCNLTKRENESKNLDEEQWYGEKYTLYKGL